MPHTNCFFFYYNVYYYLLSNIIITQSIRLSKALPAAARGTVECISDILTEDAARSVIMGEDKMTFLYLRNGDKFFFDFIIIIFLVEKKKEIHYSDY